MEEGGEVYCRKVHRVLLAYRSTCPGCPVLVHKTRAFCTSCPQPGPTLGAEVTTVLVKVERERSLHSRGRNGRETAGKYVE